MKLLSILKNIIAGVLIVLALWVIYSITAFILGDTWTSWGLGKVTGLFVSMFKFVFIATIPCLIPPIVIYLLIQFMIRNPIIRAAAGIGSVYIFWTLSGGLGLFSWVTLYAPIDTVIRIVKLLFQVYFLIVLVMPPELMNIIGTIAGVFGSMVIYIFPDAPGALDDIAAVCTLISIIFVYMNTLATFIKNQIGTRIDRLHKYISAKLELNDNNDNDNEEDDD